MMAAPIKRGTVADPPLSLLSFTVIGALALDANVVVVVVVDVVVDVDVVVVDDVDVVVVVVVGEVGVTLVVGGSVSGVVVLEVSSPRTVTEPVIDACTLQ